MENGFIKNLEAVFRHDALNQAGTQTGLDESRYSAQRSPTNARRLIAPRV